MLQKMRNSVTVRGLRYARSAFARFPTPRFQHAAWYRWLLSTRWEDALLQHVAYCSLHSTWFPFVHALFKPEWWRTYSSRFSARCEELWKFSFVASGRKAMPAIAVASTPHAPSPHPGIWPDGRSLRTTIGAVPDAFSRAYLHTDRRVRNRADSRLWKNRF